MNRNRHLIKFFTIWLICVTAVFGQKKYALIIGSNYTGNSAKINPLELCEADANYLKEKVKQEGNFDEVRLLLGKDVLRSNIEAEINRLAKKAGKDDTVFLYFSGHGAFQEDPNAENGMRNILICYARPHLPDNVLNDYMKRIESPKTVFVFDCCFSGGIAKKGVKTRGAYGVPIPEGKDGTVLQNPEDFFFQDKAIVSSADSNESAWEIRGGGINHGIFTYYFGKAFGTADLNKDNVVTVLEAFFKARKDTISEAARIHQSQHPQISGNASGIILAGKPVPPAAKPPVTQPSPPEKVEPPKPSTPAPDFKPSPSDTHQAVVDEQEPPAKQSPEKGDLILHTTIIANRSYGVSSLSPWERLNAGDRKGDRKVRVLLGGEVYPAKITKVSSKIWGAETQMGKIHPGQIYEIQISNIPSGVQELVIQADDYPEIKKTIAVMPKEKNEVDIVATMAGFGAIQGKVFYKTLDNPVANQPIYMPTISNLTGVYKVFTDSEGNFWYTNLQEGDYEIQASFAEDLKLNNSEIEVKEGQITKVNIILNVKLPSTKTKY